MQSTWIDATQMNFQNFDRNFKQLFTSRKKREGWIIGERDAAQLEFRVAGFLGNDSRVKEDVEQGADVHAFTRDVLINAGEPTDRTGAKSRTFKPLFGGTSGTKAEKAYYKEFKKKYKGVADTQDEWVQSALMTKVQTIATGLKFYWPKIRLTRTGYIEGNTNVRNYPIQSLATADIIPVGVTYVWHHMKEKAMQSLLINTVHDSIITDENPEETEELNEITTTAFSTEVISYLKKVYDINFTIPLEIETEVSENWGYYPPKIIRK